MVTCTGPVLGIPMARLFWAARERCACMALRAISRWNLCIISWEAVLSPPTVALRRSGIKCGSHRRIADNGNATVRLDEGLPSVAHDLRPSTRAVYVS